MPESFPESFLRKLESAGTDAFKLIETFVAESRAEDLYLDFKRKSNPSIAAINDDDKKNLSKAVSGFANSAGGLIVWGVIAEGGKDPEVPDVAKALDPIKNLDSFHSILNDSLQAATRPTVSHARNVKVPASGISGGYVVTYVPEVENPPYRAEWSKKLFYKRAGSRFYEMEPFDIRDVISRGRYPKIQVETSWTLYKKEKSLHVYELAILLVNRGPTVLDSWKFVIEYPQAISAIHEAASLPTDFDGYNTFVGIDGETRERAFIFSHPGFQPAYHQLIPLFPEDGVQLFGQTGRFHLPYKMNDELFRQTWKMKWRFYADGPPMQEGEIVIGPGSYCNF